MGLWPFGKKKHQADNADEDAPQEAVQPSLAEAELGVGAAGGESDVSKAGTATDSDTGAPGAPAGTGEEAPIERAPGTDPLSDYDPVGGSTGPFDGDSVLIEDFDFTDFSDATLNLGSMRIPLPKGTQVQVEMGEQGPKMVHVVTQSGRLTPVAFAAPRTGGLWEESAAEIAEGMRSEGMPVRFEQGPWGKEIVGTGTNGVIRIIGVEGPRWLYRVTLAAPDGREDAMAQLGREVIARSFVYRGEAPVLAGNSLPVTLPEQLARQVQQAVAQRAAQQQGQQDKPAGGQAPAGGNPNALSDALRQIMEHNAANNPANNAANKSADHTARNTPDATGEATPTDGIQNDR